MGFAKHDQLYIGGEWVAPIGTGVIEVHNPTTEQLIGQIPAGSAEDMDKAVHAAAAALPSWLATPPGERAAYCERIGKYMMDRLDDLVDTIARELGSPLEFTRGIQTSWPIAKFLAMPALAAETVFAEEHGDSVILREGVGVVAAITPWNYPMLQIADKVAPALTAGCTVILKPSEITPLNAYLLAEAVHASGLPAGVFNLVTGYGPEAGEALVGHPLVDMVSFTGSTRAGRRISEIAAATVKATAMELGGKSPNIILDDFDEGRLREIVAAGIANCYENSGQTCSALTRMIVPRAQLAAVEAAAIQAAAAMQLGDPFAASTVLGPLVSEAQRERVRDYITVGVAEGARLIVGESSRRPAFRSATSSRPRSSAMSARICASRRRRSSAPCCRSSRATARRRPSRSPTAPTTAWPQRCGPRIRRGPSGWPCGSAAASSRSMAATARPTRRSGASSNPAMAARAASSAWTSS
ncbi:MAG: aldehyde dehydrogenase family protein [Jatrophihabitantaceae bacterium]|nr:aldehyde dehydrogenase family protein [Jatrophihabitantaceae bacterium]